MKAAEFTDEENWTGGYYELAIELGSRDDFRLEQALVAVWKLAALEGPFRSRSVRRELQQRVSPTVDEPGRLHGLATLPSRIQVVCGTITLRLEDDSDWVSLFIPLGSLARVETNIGGFPFGGYGDSLAWRRPLDDWLARLAKHVYRELRFPFAVIGHEVLAERTASQFTSGPPTSRTEGLLIATPAGLCYHPVTREY